MKQLYYVVQTLLRGRGSNVFKVISLGLGLAVSILLFSRVAYERSYDTCFRDYDKLYQLWTTWNMNGQIYGPSSRNIGKIGGAVLEAMPEYIESATSVGDWGMDYPLFYGDVRFEPTAAFADSLFFQTLGIEVLKGNPVQDLVQPDLIYLCESLAKRIFGEEDPIGKVIHYGKDFQLTVKGVYADLPDNCTISRESIISLPSILKRGWTNYSWDGGDSWLQYIRLKKDIDREELDKRIDVVLQRNLPSYAQYEMTINAKPIRETYQDSEDVKRMTNIMLILGVSILFITALNYVLISIASLSRRAKAIGVHKCSGAETGTVFGMFLWETAIIIVLALLLMAFLILNFQNFVEDTASTKLVNLFAWDRIWVPVSVTFVLFLIGGILPGWMFSRIPVTQVFRRYTESKSGWKRTLLFVQFAGVAFIFGLMCAVMLQYHNVMNQSLGYNPENVVVIERTLEEKREALNTASSFYRSLPYVEAVSGSWASYPAGGYSGEMIRDDQGKTMFSSRYDYVVKGYTEFMDMKMLQGRAPKERGEIAVNEDFARRMHWGNEVVGRQVQTEEGPCRVVGLLEDFNVNTFYKEISPLALHYYPADLAPRVYLRLKEPFSENLQRLNEEAAEVFPTEEVHFDSLEKLIAHNYNSVRVFRNATIVSGIVILLITLMGLIGYTNDELQRRSKEIAIRKVNGAEASSILELFVGNILWISLPAVCIGTFAAWYVGTLWLEQFTVVVGSMIPYYVCAGLLVLGIIVGCVVVRTWKIANENPVKSIKSE